MFDRRPQTVGFPANEPGFCLDKAASRPSVDLTGYAWTQTVSAGPANLCRNALACPNHGDADSACLGSRQFICRLCKDRSSNRRTLHPTPFCWSMVVTRLFPELNNHSTTLSSSPTAFRHRPESAGGSPANFFRYTGCFPFRSLQRLFFHVAIGYPRCAIRHDTYHE